ncbi:hypothetical protein CKAH01_09096 [Colletotrichum kahawae]|uniref:Uncharacterized protein n=1 Tax=Colletotrichum kahawae TaxID=34407 RepID=A0AAD9Y0U1_COLKA|nr:hypothetical protein CKAH01_09096 [Colletotrichum kahawae]
MWQGREQPTATGIDWRTTLSGSPSLSKAVMFGPEHCLVCLESPALE